ncbi:response regulator [Maridesulfovibrio sp.]|uniref:response regulator n=1 Tax=Maridesulfovibrio sp. TaxID=2795000 RepID=UPI002AA774B6|nr:response regulator [Maridesulfovibrio sp.]
MIFFCDTDQVAKLSFVRGICLSFFLLFIVCLLGPGCTAVADDFPGTEKKKTEVDLKLTPEEEAFVRSGVKLRMSEVNWEPLSIVDEDDQFKGIIADYMDMISVLSGLQFEFVPSRSWAEVLQKYTNGELDIIPALSIRDMVERDVLFSDAYVSFPLVIVTSDTALSVKSLDEFKKKRVAAGLNYTSYYYVQENYPEIDLVGTLDVEEGLLLLTKGKVDAFVGHLAVVVDSMNRLGLKNLKIAGTTKFDFDHRIGVSPDYPLAFSIINKALAAITDDYHRKIRQKWFNVRYEQVSDYRELLFLFAFLIMALATIIFWNRKLFKLNESLNKEVAQRRRMEKAHNLLYEIALAVPRVSGIDEFYPIIQGQINKLMPARNFYIAAYDRETDIISFPYFSDERETTPAPRKIGAGLTDYVLRTGKPLFGDWATRMEMLEKGDYEQIGAERELWLGVPLKLQEDVVGVMAVQSYEDDQILDERDFEVLLFLSSYVGLALERLFLMEKGREQTLALKEREIKYRSIFDNASDAILLMDLDYNLVSANPEAVSMFRCSSEEELLSYRPENLIVPNQFEGVFFDGLLEDLSRTSVAKGELDFDIVCRRLDGEEFFASVRARKMDISGRPLLQTTLSDVTEQRRTKKELQDSYHRLHDIVEFLPDPTIVIDSKGTVLAWNKAVEEATGVRKEDIIGKGDHEYSLSFYGERRPILIDFALRDDLEPLTDEYESLERRGDKVYGEVYTPRAFGGEGAYFWGIAGPLRNQTGQIVGAVECMRNVTERRQVEKELNRSRLAAEAATRAKSEFLANMSHEIRTPMNSILGFGHLLQNAELDPLQREYLDKMMSSADSLLSIIGDILDFSKIEAGKFVLEDVEFNLDDVLEKICNMVAVKAECKGIDFVLSVEPEVPFNLRGDPLRLGQVLINLTNNAVKFTDTGEVSLIVACETDCDGDSRIRFTVRDSGIGLSREEISMLFNSFTQADASTTRKYGGTGLGLAIARSLVELMGGSVSVESQPGLGSSFYFTIPLSAVGKENSIVLPEIAEGMKVLVVESNRIARDFVRSTLENAGFRVAVDSSASAALERLAGQSAKDAFSFILISGKLYDMHVTDAVGRIRGIAGLENIPIILMAPVNVDDSFRREAALMGVDGFVSRPVTRTSLYSSLGDEFAELENSAAPADYGEPVPEIGFSGTAPRVLVVEDNELNQQVARRMLESLGLTVDVAENGRKALDALNSEIYNLVLMDIQMPEMDGLTAARIIRSDIRYAKLPILAMTAHAMPGDREKSIAAGMNEHLIKPVNPDDLKKALGKYLDVDIVAYTPLADDAGIEDEPPLQFPGINSAKGLLNIGNNRESYLKVLQGFRNGYENFPAELRSILDESGREQALMKIHSLKGVAGNIGAGNIYELCRALESDMRAEGSGGYTESLNYLIAELQMVLKGLEGLDVSKVPQSREYVFDKEKSFNLISKLYIMLGEGDAESGDVLDELRVHFNLESYTEQLDELTRHIENFDFDDGRSVLEFIAEKLGVQLGKG